MFNIELLLARPGQPSQVWDLSEDSSAFSIQVQKYNHKYCRLFAFVGARVTAGFPICGRSC